MEQGTKDCHSTGRRKFCMVLCQDQGAVVLGAERGADEMVVYKLFIVVLPIELSSAQVIITPFNHQKRTCLRLGDIV